MRNAPAGKAADNYLYFGDNLEVLRKRIPDESVDLVYLDPPFKSDQSYNVLFKERDGTAAVAQVHAFDDSWRWPEAVSAYQESVERGGRVGEALQAFHTLVGPSDMMAYLTMMAPRLVELRRVMKPTGSLYLHCDPTASHYLKLLLDAVFGPGQFRNEIIWKRSSAHSSARRYGPVHDTLLFYTKGDSFTWNPAFQPIPQETADAWYNNVEEGTGRRFNRADLTANGERTGPSGATWRGVNPSQKGRHWAIPGFVRHLIGDGDTLEALDQLDAIGRIHWPKKAGGTPMLKRYLDESPGIPAQDIITDISPLNNSTAERLGYPTQKPVALLERLVSASSNPGDVILDPFCGCGTAISAAQKLGRRWIGIDITQVAIGIIRTRLHAEFGLAARIDYAVDGDPVSVADAVELAEYDRFQFQVWAVNTLAGRPVEQKKGRDQGIDGKLYFHDEPASAGGTTKLVVISVKSGATGVRDVRDLVGVVSREKAAIGVMVTLNDPTRDMRVEAANAGFYTSPGWKTRHPKVQILTVSDMLVEGRGINMPPVSQTNQTFTKPRRVRTSARGKTKQPTPSLFGDSNDQ